MPREAMVIRGRILARLLGLRLLTLDTDITIASPPWLRLDPGEAGPQPPAAIGPGRSSPAAQRPLAAGRTDLARPDGRAQRIRAARAVPGSGVTRARELVRQGTRALDSAPPRRTPPAPR
jgi:hypothetical protein